MEEVIVEAGEKKWSLLAGNAKGSAMHARYADQDEVYLAKGIKSWDISHQIASYADTRHSTDDPVEIRVRNPTVKSHQNVQMMANGWLLNFHRAPKSMPLA